MCGPQWPGRSVILYGYFSVLTWFAESHSGGRRSSSRVQHAYIGEGHGNKNLGGY